MKRSNNRCVYSDYNGQPEQERPDQRRTIERQGSPWQTFSRLRQSERTTAQPAHMIVGSNLMEIDWWEKDHGAFVSYKLHPTVFNSLVAMEIDCGSTNMEMDWYARSNNQFR